MSRTCALGRALTIPAPIGWATAHVARLVAILALVALFVVGTVLPINMGALAFVAAWLVGMFALDLDEEDIIAGISGDLVLTLRSMRRLSQADARLQRDRLGSGSSLVWAIVVAPSWL